MAKGKARGQTGPVTYDITKERILIKVLGELYLLAQVSHRQIAAIKLAPHGNRFSDPVMVKDTQRLTKADLDRVVGNGKYDYELILGAKILVRWPDAKENTGQETC